MSRRIRLLDRPWVGMRVSFRMTGLPAHDVDDVVDYLRTRWHLGDRGVRWAHTGQWRMRPVALREIDASTPDLVIDRRGEPDADVERALLDGSLLAEPGWCVSVLLTDEHTYFMVDHGTGDAAYLMEVARTFRMFLTDRVSWDLGGERARVRDLAAVVARVLAQQPATLLMLPARFARRRAARGAAGPVAALPATRERFASVLVPQDRWEALSAWRGEQSTRISEQVALLVGFVRRAAAEGVDVDHLTLSGMADLRRYGGALVHCDSNLLGNLLSELDAREPDAMARLSAGWHRTLTSGLPAVVALASALTWAGRRRADRVPRTAQMGTSHMTMPSLRDDSGHGVITEIMFRAKPRTVDLTLHPSTGGVLVNVAWDAAFVPEDAMARLLKHLADDPAGFVGSSGRSHA